MAASGLTEDLKQQLECPICLEEFKEPKVLPCLHSFCKTCLEGVLVQDKDGTWTIPCPSCCKVVKILWLKCDNCVGGDPAVSRCTSCLQFLCKFCEEAHRRARKTNSHILMSMSEVKLEGSSTVIKPSTCEKHEQKKLKLFCESCDKAICRDCTVVEHRDHKYVFAKDAYARKVEGLRNLLQATKTKIAVLKNAVESVADMAICVGISAENSEKTVNDSINSLIKRMEDRRKNLLSDISNVKFKKMKELETQKEELELALGSMQSSVNFTVQAIKDGSHVNLLQMIPQMASRLKELSTATWQLRPCVGDACKFQADERQLHEGILQFGSIRADQTNASLSTVLMGNGDEGVTYSTLCNQPVEFQIVAWDYHGKKLHKGGDLITATVQAPGQQDASVIDEVTDNGDGMYTFTFNPQVAGLHHLSVKLNEQDVKGAPLVWNVETWTLTQVKRSFSNKISFADGNMKVRAVGDVITPMCHTSISGSRGFSTGQHMWKVKICKTSGYVAAGIVEKEQRAKGNSCWNHGKQWMQGNGQKYQPSDGSAVQSTITSLVTDDVLELLLDCDKGKLMIHNQRSGESDHFEGFGGFELFPAIYLFERTDTVSLLQL